MRGDPLIKEFLEALLLDKYCGHSVIPACRESFWIQPRDKKDTRCESSRESLLPDKPEWHLWISHPDPESLRDSGL